MAKSERGLTPIVKKVFRIITTIITIFIQLVLYMVLFLQIPTYNYIQIALDIVAIMISIEIYRSDSNPGYKQSWIIMVMLLPLAGVLLYLIYGQGRTLPNRKFKKIERYSLLNIEDNCVISEIANDDHRKMVTMLMRDTGLVPHGNTNTMFLNDGIDIFQAIISEIKGAKKFVFLEYFIISKGDLWNILRELIVEKANQGVEIKIIYDDIGSGKALSKKDIKTLTEHPNIAISAYNPLGVNFSLSLNYRDHRKITVVDGRYAFVGGSNIADEYVHAKRRFGFWRDNGMEIEGDAVHNYTILFIQMWYMSTREVIDPMEYKYDNPIIDAKGYVFPFGDGPILKTNPAYNLLLSMFVNAKKYVYISTPYFIIDSTLISLLKNAIRSGVDVRILVPHVPDKKSVFLMTRAHYREILLAGGKIYEFTEGFNHAKTVICDDTYALIGTINIDYRSLFLHFECANFLIDTPSILDMKEDFMRALETSELIEVTKWENRSVFAKIIEFILTLLAPLM